MARRMCTTTLRTFALLLALAGAALATTSCRTASPSVRLERLFDDLQSDLSSQPLTAAEGEVWMARQKERIAKVHALLDAGEVASAADHLHAAVILVETDSERDLERARDVAREAGELGELKGFRVVAEAVDRLAVKRGVPQKYGTQYVYEEVLGKWRLYPCDPLTTEEERAAMGVGSMSEILAREAQLNAELGGRRE